MASTDIPTTLRTTEVLGLTLSAFLSGGIAALSHVAIPSLHHAPAAIQAQQWRTLYRRGAATAPTLAAISSSLLAYSGFTSTSPHRTKLLAAAACVAAIAPYTLLRMAGTNGALAAYADRYRLGVSTEATAAEAEDVGRLLRRWRGMNAVRAGLVFVGTGLAWWGLLGEWAGLA